MATEELVGTCEWLFDELCRTALIDREQVEPLVAEFLIDNPYADAGALGEFLVARGILTRYQVDRSIEGDIKSLLLGPYILIEPIGTGSMGTVFSAVGKADKQKYAVKVLPLRSIWNVRIARRQVRSFVELPPHPAIVPFIDVGTVINKHYLVWPFVEGQTLEAVTNSHGALPWPEAARIALRLAEGLQLCHQKSLFHGLIKPSNIMLGAGALIKLIDFGIGALLAENTDESLLDTMSTANATAGMLDCASPESILDPSKRSTAGDQYSLGCVIYFMLTGRYPYPSGNMVDKMMAHQMMTAPPIHQFNPDVPAEFITIVERLMEKAPESRYRDIGEVLHDLNQLVKQQPVSTLTIFNMAAITQEKSPMEDTAALARPDVPSLHDLKAVPPTLPEPAAPPAPSAGPPAAPRQIPLAAGAASWPDVDLNPSPAAEPAEPALPTTPRKSFFGRVLGKLAFWRPTRDALSISIMAPPQLPHDQTVSLPVFAHVQSADNIANMGQTYFPNHVVVATVPLRTEVARGARLTFHLALPGITVEQPVQKFVWRGQTMPLPFSVRVPIDCRPGEIVGIISIGENADIIANCEFRVQIG